MLAPIGISTYIRLQHLQQTISALQQNILAEESELFVFSDAPKSGDEDKVRALRNYLYTVEGFKKVHIVERKENSRVRNNRDGLSMLLDRFGRAIFLEDDILTAQNFLSFMNQALDRYETNQKVFSVTGYCPPIPIPAEYRYDLFFLRRFNGWGFGIWKDRYESIQHISLEEFMRFSNNRSQIKLFERGGGHDMTEMLKADAHGKIDALDVKAMYTQFLADQYTVYPTESLTFNCGMDGSGVHCGVTDRFDVGLSGKKTFFLPDSLVIDPRILKANLKFRPGPTHMQRIKIGTRGFVKKLVGKNLVNLIKKYTN